MNKMCARLWSTKVPSLLAVLKHGDIACVIHFFMPCMFFSTIFMFHKYQQRSYYATILFDQL